MENLENIEFFAYLRESIDLVSGIAIQREKIEKYAEYKEIKITKWFVDNNRSAYKYRPEYENMMGELFLETCKVRGVICSSLSRFGRNAGETLQEHNKLKLSGKELILVNDNIDSTTSAGKAMLGMLAVFNDFERDTIVERLSAGRAWARENGTKSGKPLNRPELKIDWRKFDEYKKLKLSIPSIAKLLGVSKSKMYVAIGKRDNL